mmetsp:Transcript_15093/g.40824  ORF Transcript_15093/g.40824 Transcript_15093/m.40824 type:complete len:443 (+) Transcript_15093:139-1467(+)
MKPHEREALQGAVHCGQQEPCEPGPSTSGSGRDGMLRIGCALLPKKVSRYLTPSMKLAAANNDIELCLIDYMRPLNEQGPFDAIIHKLRPNKEWERNLLDYSKAHPDVTVIDRVDGIRALQNRSTMLSVLNGEGIVLQPTSDRQLAQEESYFMEGDSGQARMQIRVQAPVQVEIPEGSTLEQAKQRLEGAGLQPPLLVKPLWTDGREGSHGLAVLHDIKSLEKLVVGLSEDLQPPLVVQQFVEHGGVLYKVYVLGNRTVVTKRPSLGDKYLDKEARGKGVMHLPRISCKADYCPPGTNQAAHQLAASVSCDMDEFCEAPPEWITHTLADVLRRRLGLQLFNFDLICPEEQISPNECLYYVIDINYFPGVDKIPNFEQAFVHFLRTACEEEDQHHPSHAQRHSQQQQQLQPSSQQQDSQIADSGQGSPTTHVSTGVQQHVLAA